MMEKRRAKLPVPISATTTQPRIAQEHQRGQKSIKGPSGFIVGRRGKGERRDSKDRIFRGMECRDKPVWNRE